MRFTPEQRQFSDAIRDFCARECGTLAQRMAWTQDGAEQTSPACHALVYDIADRIDHGEEDELSSLSNEIQREIVSRGLGL
jgi:hypothetical protein